MASREVNITSEWLRGRMQLMKDDRAKLHAQYPDHFHKDEHAGIVPDLINEILRLRGEPVIEFEWSSYPEFVLHS